MRGLEVLLSEGGVFMTESHYLLEIIRGVQYDSVYHEHLRSYSLKSLVTLLEMYDFTVVDARQVSRYGGNIRVYAARGKNRPVKSSVGRILAEEERFGLYSSEVYTDFREKTRKSKDDLLRFALEAASRGERLVGNSCPGRCSTLLNYCNVDRDYMPYIAEQPTSLKLGLHLPGLHIPIVDNKILLEEQPEYVVLLAWHLWKPISEQLRARGLKSKFVVPLPEVHVLKD